MMHLLAGLPGILEEALNSLTAFDALLYYLPLGLLGLFRWSVWFVKKGAGAAYVPMLPNRHPATVSVITPVYREDPFHFRLAVRSWASERPLEIIAVIDSRDTDCIRQFEELQKMITETNLVLIVTDEPGKRPALVKGIQLASGEVCALADSDTLWEYGMLDVIRAPFIDPKVGGVATRQNVFNPTNVWQKVADIYLDIRFTEEMPFLAATGDRLTCLSGRTAVYRRSVLLPILDDFLNETFLGQKCISGEDKRFTYLVQGAGYSTRYQMNARVYTVAPRDFSTFIKQRIRWSRNSWRADLRALGEGWVWRRPVFALFLIDRMLAPFVGLFAPIFLTLTIVAGHWLLAGLIIAWWLASRTLKISAHLVERPTDIAIVPAYIAVNYLLLTLRVFALVTIRQQGWITRGAGRAGMNVLSLGATAGIFLLLVAAAVGYQRGANALHNEPRVIEAAAPSESLPSSADIAPGQRRGGDGAFSAVELRALGQAYLASGLTIEEFTNRLLNTAAEVNDEDDDR